MKNQLDINDLSPCFGKLNVNLELTFLRKLLLKAANNNKPHYSKTLMNQLKMKPTKGLQSNTTIYGWFAGKNSVPLDKLNTLVNLSGFSWQSITSNLVCIKGKSHNIKLKPSFPIKIDKDFGCIIGHILGDGSIIKCNQQVFFSNSEKVLLKEFEKCMDKIFGVKPRIWMQKEAIYGKTKWDRRIDSIEDLKEGRCCGLFYPTICGFILNGAFGNFAVGKEKNITTKINNCNKDFKHGLIRAFFDDESTVTEKSIRVFQDRKEILADIKSFLINFGIFGGETKSCIKRNKIRYYFTIFRKSNLRQFVKEIGFTSPKKQQKLFEITNKKIHWNDK